MPTLMQTNEIDRISSIKQLSTEQLALTVIRVRRIIREQQALKFRAQDPGTGGQGMAGRERYVIVCIQRLTISRISTTITIIIMNT